MTKIINKEMYCKKCNKNYVVPVVLSTSSVMLQRDPILKKRYEEGKLFVNECPVCGEKLEKIN